MLLHVTTLTEKIRLVPSIINDTCMFIVLESFLVSQQIWDVRCVGHGCFSVQRLTSMTRPNKHMTKTHGSWWCTAE